MTQKVLILNRLKTGEWFSTVQCVNEYRILRLSARILDLRNDLEEKKSPYEIIERRVAGTSYSEYKLQLRPGYELKASKPSPTAICSTISTPSQAPEVPAREAFDRPAHYTQDGLFDKSHAQRTWRAATTTDHNASSSST
jgi:Helix-turn-helix domain